MRTPLEGAYLLGSIARSPTAPDVTALAMIFGNLTPGAPLVRVHSQCFTSEVLGSLRCDFNDQWEIAMRTIAAEGRRLVIHEHQEGRGIGLMAKLRAYALQDAELKRQHHHTATGRWAPSSDRRGPVPTG